MGFLRSETYAACGLCVAIGSDRSGENDDLRLFSIESQNFLGVNCLVVLFGRQNLETSQPSESFRCTFLRR